jgi:hypothetical protein
MRTIVYVLLLVLFAGVVALFVVQPRHSLATEIVIAAPPERVWRELTDFASYPQWNPFVRSIKGEARAGTRLEAVIGNPGSEPMTLTPEVLVADPPREFRWRGSLSVPGTFVGEHYFILEPHAAGTRLVHGEEFHGALIPFMGASFWHATRSGLVAMNEGLKARAEAPKASAQHMERPTPR